MGEPARRKLSYAEYLELEGRSEAKHEYVDGLVFAMSGGTLEHSRLAAEVSYQLRRALEGEPCRVLSSDGRLRIPSTNEGRYADAVVVCGDVERSPDDAEGLLNPTLVVEVLSPSTERVDRGDKLRSYKQISSLREYLLVSQDRERLELYRRVEQGWLHLEAGPGETLELASIGASVDVDALYRDRI